MCQEELEALKGSKCQAPHKQNWGGHSYHNALIVAIEAEDNVQDMNHIQVCLLDIVNILLNVREDIVVDYLKLDLFICFSTLI